MKDLIRIVDFIRFERRIDKLNESKFRRFRDETLSNRTFVAIYFVRTIKEKPAIFLDQKRRDIKCHTSFTYVSVSKSSLEGGKASEIYTQNARKKSGEFENIKINRFPKNLTDLNPIV